jgi:hypothetical protein
MGLSTICIIQPYLTWQCLVQINHLQYNHMKFKQIKLLECHDNIIPSNDHNWNSSMHIPHCSVEWWLHQTPTCNLANVNVIAPLKLEIRQS